MLNEDIYRRLREVLRQADIPDAGYEAGLLLEAVTGHTRFADYSPTGEEQAALETLASRRTTHEPLQYLLGSWPFMGLELAVGPGVLIPRADTECVCEAAMDLIKNVSIPTVLDLCSGTGALALGIAAARPDASVTAVELYDEAYGYLVRNTKTFAAADPCAPKTVQHDALTYHSQLQNDALDLLVCNPPYVTAEEYEALAPELSHEPKTALVAGEEGLAFYKAIARDYYPKLKAGGWLVFEIGSGQASALRAILARHSYRDIAIRQDLAGLDRVAIGHK